MVGAHAFCNWMGLPRVWGRVGGNVVTMGVAKVKDRGVKAGIVVGGREGNMPELKAMGQETVMGEVSGKGEDDGVKDSGKVFQAEYQGLGVGWTVAYYFLLVGGAVAFWKGFWVLTKSENALVEWGDR